MGLYIMIEITIVQCKLRAIRIASSVAEFFTQLVIKSKLSLFGTSHHNWVQTSIEGLELSKKAINYQGGFRANKVRKLYK